MEKRRRRREREANIWAASAFALLAGDGKRVEVQQQRMPAFGGDLVPFFLPVDAITAAPN